MLCMCVLCLSWIEWIDIINKFLYEVGSVGVDTLLCVSIARWLFLISCPFGFHPVLLTFLLCRLRVTFSVCKFGALKMVLLLISIICSSIFTYNGEVAVRPVLMKNAQECGVSSSVLCPYHILLDKNCTGFPFQKVLSIKLLVCVLVL